MKKYDYFKVFSNEIRLKVFKMLLQERLCVSKIVENLSVSQPTVTQHLKLLEHCELVKSEKIGPWVHYSVNLPGIKRCAEEFEGFIKILEGASDKESRCRTGKCSKSGKKTD